MHRCRFPEQFSPSPSCAHIPQLNRPYDITIIWLWTVHQTLVKWGVSIYFHPYGCLGLSPLITELMISFYISGRVTRLSLPNDHPLGWRELWRHSCINARSLPHRQQVNQHHLSVVRLRQNFPSENNDAEQHSQRHHWQILQQSCI